jgi:hypothetical protein
MVNSRSLQNTLSLCSLVANEEASVRVMGTINQSIGTINALFREICKYDLIATGHFL